MIFRYCLKNSMLVEFEVNRTRNTASKIKTAIKLIPDKIMPTRAFCGLVRSPLESAPRIKASPAKTRASGGIQQIDNRERIPRIKEAEAQLELP